MIQKFIRVFASFLYRTKNYKYLINIFGEESFNKIGIKYVYKNVITVKCYELPDYFIDDYDQRRLYSLFEDEKTMQSYDFIFGLFEVKRAKLEMPHGMVRIKNGLVERLMGDTVFPLNNPRYYFSFFRSYIFSKRVVKNSVLLTLPFDNNYYHWLIETLPRLSILELAGYKAKNTKLLMPPVGSRPAFVGDSLALVGWHENQDCLDSGVYTASNLIVPSLTSPRSRISPFAANWLREKILRSSNPSISEKDEYSYERIYISRDDAPTRHVKNSVEMDELIKKFGFVKVTMSGKSVYEQAKLFASAKYIIGIHGAALANIIFCNKGVKFLEVFMGGLFTKAFFNLSRDREMLYGCFLAENLDNNLFVDTAKLNILMLKMFDKVES